MTEDPKNRNWSEDEIAALIDGSLTDEAEAERVRQILETDPEAAAFADELRLLRRLSREAFDAPMREPVPERILSAIEGAADEARPAAPARRPRLARPAWRRGRDFPTPARSWVGMAAAAAVALVIGAGAAQFWRAPVGAVASLGDASVDGALHAALETLASGAVSEEGVQPMWSFRDGEGRPCREFEVIGKPPEELGFGVACRTEGGRWYVEMLAAAPRTAPGPDGYAPASGPAASALDSLLEALDASAPLSPSEEAELIAGGWRAGAAGEAD